MPDAAADAYRDLGLFLPGVGERSCTDVGSEMTPTLEAVGPVGGSVGDLGAVDISVENEDLNDELMAAEQKKIPTRTMS